MSKKPTKKKVVVGKKKASAGRKTIAPTVSRARTNNVTSVRSDELIFGRQNYMLMIAGAVLVGLGLLLMAGGGMSDPNTWDPDVIYSGRRTILAPMVILAGLIVEIVAIFKR